MKKVFRKTESPLTRLFKGIKAYLRRSSRLVKSLILLLSIVILIVLFNSEGNKFRLSLINSSYELYGYSSEVVHDLYNKVSDISFCKGENLQDPQFQRDNKYLKLQNSILDEELKLLKSKLKLIDNRQFLWITANVTQVTYPRDEMALVVSAGEKDGVALGNIVLDEDGVVGRISTVGSNYSVVSLIGNENVKISAIVHPSDQDCIVGQRFDPYHLELNYIGDFDKINDGDKVISSGKDGLTPYGIAIGVIRKMSDKPFVVVEKNEKINTIVKIITSNSQP